jgi:hypothetical protein
LIGRLYPNGTKDGMPPFCRITLVTMDIMDSSIFPVEMDLFIIGSCRTGRIFHMALIDSRIKEFL